MSKNLLVKILLSICIVALLGFIFFSPSTPVIDMTPEKEQKIFTLLETHPDVEEWLALFDEPNIAPGKPKGRPGYSIENLGQDQYRVRVAENSFDQKRIITFGFFIVDLATSSVTREDIGPDTP